MLSIAPYASAISYPPKHSEPARPSVPKPISAHEATPLRFGTLHQKALPGKHKPILLSLDLDRSLLKWKRYNETIDMDEFNRVIRLIHKHRDHVTVAVNTARSPDAIKMIGHLFKHFPLDYLILHDGKMLIPKTDPDMPTDQWIYSLNAEAAHDRGWQREVVWPIQRVLDIQDEVLKQEGFIPDPQQPQQGEAGWLRLNLIKPDGKHPPYRILGSTADMISPMLLAEPPELRPHLLQYANDMARKMVERIRRENLPAEPHIYQWKSTWGDMFHVFGPSRPGIHKASPIEYLVREFDQPKHVVSVGDSGNDREMLTAPGYRDKHGHAVTNTPIYHNNIGLEDTLYRELAPNPEAYIIAPESFQENAQAAKSSRDLPHALGDILNQKTSKLPKPQGTLLKFGAVQRTRQARAQEGPMIRPPNWYFPEKFVTLMDLLAERANLPNGAHYIARVMGKHLFDACLNRSPFKQIMPPVTVAVQGMHHGQPVATQVTSLLGPQQILEAWNRVLDSAKDSIQVALYDFDHIDVPGGRNPDGADFHAHWMLQQQVLPKIVAKAREFKKQGGGRKVQVLLDASHQEERSAYGGVKRRSINNEGMVAALRELANKENLPIEVVHYPRELAKLYHVKLLLVDSQKAIVGGMNMSNHSPANWDACVLLEGPEVANLQTQTFNQDWVVARCVEQLQQQYPWKQVAKQLSKLTPNDYKPFMAELPQGATPVSHPAIRVLNTIPAEYQAFGFQPREEIGDYLKQTFSDPKLQEVLGEQFVLTHKGLVRQMVERHQQNNLKVRLLHSMGVIRQFPYTRKGVHMLEETGGSELLRYYRENPHTQEQLHAKLLLLKRLQANRKPGWEIFIGSSNTSKVGLETNVEAGRRSDYPNRDEVYQRGNREVALVIASDKLAEPYVKQFDVDWQYSDLKMPNMLGSADFARQNLEGMPSPEAFDGDVFEAVLRQLGASSSSPQRPHLQFGRR
ncbi:MAG TPA: phospholipase D-like domain-containing protein [Coleofasciculaceae cyanobacterium]|jgi:hypothetical protein